MTYHELRRNMIQKAAQQKIPILGEFELTAQCNLRCKMCYVVNQKSTDLDTETWKSIFDDAKDAGLLFALLTGGEIFTRPDFVELYTYLYDLGIRITLFSNGVTLPQEALDAFIQRPPEYIAITLYGSNNDTYELITNHKTGFDHVNNTINKLQEAGINTVLRTIPLTPIYDDLDNIINYVKSKGLSLSFTEYIGPTRTGNFDHKILRLSPNKLHDFSTRITNAFSKKPSKEPVNTTTKAATCAALKSAYFINYKGYMQACAMAYKPIISVLDKPLLKAFHDLSATLKKIETYEKCQSCNLKDSCLTCYARRLLENEPLSCPSYLKAFATLKKNAKRNP